MTAFASLIAPPSVPAWSGASRVHLMSDVEPEPMPKAPRVKRKRAPAMVAPWTMLHPGSEQERSMLGTDARRYWPLIAAQGE